MKWKVWSFIGHELVNNGCTLLISEICFQPRPLVYEVTKNYYLGGNSYFMSGSEVFVEVLIQLQGESVVLVC